MKVYIAGRIADEKDYRTKFECAAAEVMALGYTAISPCEIHADCNHQAWEQWMVCDLHTLLDCEAVYALRDWQSSKGATVEVQLAMRLNKTIIYQGAPNNGNQRGAR